MWWLQGALHLPRGMVFKWVTFTSCRNQCNFFVGLVWVYDIYSAVHLLLECRTSWFDRDNPGGQGDYETLSLTLVTYPLQVCSQPIAIEVATISGAPVLPAGNNFQVYDTVLFSMLKSLIYIVHSRDNALIPQIFVHAPYPVCTSQISEIQIQHLVAVMLFCG